MNTINYKTLKAQFLDNEDAKANARTYFGTRQPSTYATGFYSSPSWNWGYCMGIVGIVLEDEIKWFEVVTQFGEVVAARSAYLPTYAMPEGNK